MVDIEHVRFAGWEDCIRMTNGTVELVATTAVGPRIVSYGFVDGPNLFYLDDEDAGATGGDEWRLYGGHRLWHAPEDTPRSYVPDNDPVEVEIESDGVVLRQPTEEQTGIQKELAVSLDGDGTGVSVTHRLFNRGLWPVELAPWGVTVMDPGGEAVVPLGRGDPDKHAADRTINLWSYTDLADDRFSFESEALRVSQREGDVEPTKIGADVRDGWAAYLLDSTAFRKSFTYHPDATYPDRNTTIEIYTDETILEVESLAPLETVEPDDVAEYTERWALVDGVTDASTAALRERLAPDA